MGACGSSEAGGGGGGDVETEQKKRSQAIDRKLEEDSKKLRRECKILLLGIRNPKLDENEADSVKDPVNRASQQS